MPGKGGPRRSVIVYPSMTVERVKQMHRDMTGYPPETIDLLYNCARLRPGYQLADYNVREGSCIDVILRIRIGIGSTIACENRNDRILKPLVTADIPLNLYPTALVNLTANNKDVIFAALKQTLAPMLVASGGRKKRRLEGGDDASHGRMRHSGNA